MRTYARSTLQLFSTGMRRGALAAGIVMMAGCAQQQASGYYDQPRGNSVTDSQYVGEGGAYRTVVRAPSQLQIPLHRNEARVQQADPAAPPSDTDAAAPPPAEGSVQALPVGERVASNGASYSDAGTTAVAASEGGSTAPRAMATGQNAPVNPATGNFAPQAQTYAGTLPCLGSGMGCANQRFVLSLAPNGRWRARVSYLDNNGTTSGKPSIEQGCWGATTARPIRLMLTDLQGNARANFESAGNALRVLSMDGQTPNLAYTLSRQPDLDPIDELSGSALPNCG